MTQIELPIFQDTEMEYREFFIGDFPLDEQLLSPPPTRELVNSIKSLGVLVPVIMTITQDKPVLRAGKRRIKAARQAISELLSEDKSTEHLQTIPTIILKCNSANIGMAVAMVENSFRSPNEVEMVNLVKKYVGLGYPMEQIVLLTGLNKAQINALLKLAGVGEIFLQSIASGRVTPRMAKDIAKLPKISQDRLLQKIKENKNLHWKDIDEEKRVRIKAATHEIKLPAMEIPEPLNLDIETAIRLALSDAGFVENVDGNIEISVNGQILSRFVWHRR